MELVYNYHQQQVRLEIIKSRELFINLVRWVLDPAFPVQSGQVKQPLCMG